MTPPRSTPFAQPTLAAAWPAVAAGLAALLGMSSCVLSFFPLTIWLAPILAVWIATFLFRVLIRYASIPDSIAAREGRVRAAAITAWVVSIIVSWAFGTKVSQVFISAGAPADNGMDAVGLAAGAILGGFVAKTVRSTGRRYMQLEPEGATIPT